MAFDITKSSMALDENDGDNLSFIRENFGQKKNNKSRIANWGFFGNCKKRNCQDLGSVRRAKK